MSKKILLLYIPTMIDPEETEKGDTPIHKAPPESYLRGPLFIQKLYDLLLSQWPSVINDIPIAN